MVAAIYLETSTSSQIGFTNNPLFKLSIELVLICMFSWCRPSVYPIFYFFINPPHWVPSQSNWFRECLIEAWRAGIAPVIKSGSSHANFALNFPHPQYPTWIIVEHDFLLLLAGLTIPVAIVEVSSCSRHKLLVPATRQEQANSQLSGSVYFRC